jgi:chromosome partitioning protein
VKQDILPHVSVESFRSSAEALKAADGFDVLVLDSTARTNAGTLEIARQAHLVATPCGASTDDLEPALLTFMELTREGIPKSKLLIALNRMMTEAEERDARAYIQQADFSCLAGSLPERTAFRAAQSIGYAITGVKYPSLRDRTDEVIQPLIDTVSDV